MLKQWWNKDKPMLTKMMMVPLFAMLFLCSVTSNVNIENIPLAIANLDNSSLSRQVVTEFENHPGFEIVLYVDSIDELHQAVYNKTAAAGLLMSSDQGKTGTARFLLDSTNSTVSGAAQGYAAGIFSTLNTGIQIQTLQASGIPDQNIAQMMGNYTYTERNLYDPYASFMYNMIYMVVPYLIQMYFICFFLLPMFWEVREKGIPKLRENTFVFFRIISMCILIGLSTYLAMLVGSKLFALTIAGLGQHFVLMVAYTIALSAVVFVISLFTDSRIKLYFFELFAIFGPIILYTSGMIWPTYAMPSGFIELVRFLWPFAIVVTPFKSLHLKGMAWVELLPTIGGLALYSLFWVAIGAAICIWRKRRKLAAPL